MQSFGERGQYGSRFEEARKRGPGPTQVEMDLLLTPHARAALSLAGEAEREIIGTEGEINKRRNALMDLRRWIRSTTCKRFNRNNTETG